VDGGSSVGQPAAPDDRPVVLTLCTGNAARSVMAGVMLEAARAPVRVVTAGTHVVENQPTSRRTRDALAVLGLAAAAHSWPIPISTAPT
jgi:protein-tyrosine-phosphatase